MAKVVGFASLFAAICLSPTTGLGIRKCSHHAWSGLIPQGFKSTCSIRYISTIRSFKGRLPQSTSGRRSLINDATPSPHSDLLDYSIAVAYSAKGHPLDLEKNIFTRDPGAKPIYSHVRPKSTRPRSGQDAFFLANVGKTDNLAFGVIDGVGGWESSGIDPADFAHGLCDYMSMEAANLSSELLGNAILPEPVKLMEHGYDRVMADRKILAGGSTACVGVAGTDGAITLANLGDSGFAHIAPFRLSYVSPAQTHAFNTPYQLSKLPPQMLRQIKLFGGPKPFSELPHDSQVTHHRLEHGDVLILATDGVWDNLSAEDLLKSTIKAMVESGAWVNGVDDKSQPDSDQLEEPTTSDKLAASSSELSRELAKTLLKEAKLASLDRKRNGPFAKEVQKFYPEENWQGGKIDDICLAVIIAVQR